METLKKKSDINTETESTIQMKIIVEITEKIKQDKTFKN